jgi:serine/threonine protein kinase/DNA-binding beta-propeller fold protein YncE
VTEGPSRPGGFGVGSRLAGYRLDEITGRGGMAVVYRAYDTRLERQVAVKVLAPELAQNDAFRQRFIRESRTAAAVDHPNIIPIYEAGEASGVLFIAMRFVTGQDVQSLVEGEGPVAVDQTCHIISQVAAALEAAHSHGLVHRDVKPGNILLDGTASYPGHAYLSDFGLSKHALSASALTSTGQLLGTLDYIAPEQIEGRGVDGRTDEYALACTAFTMFTGAPPFTRDQPVGIMWAQMSSEPPALTSRRPGLPAAVDEVMAKALAKSAGNRYATCPEFAAALRRACGIARGGGPAPVRRGPAVPASPTREETGAPPDHPATVAAAAPVIGEPPGGRKPPESGEPPESSEPAGPGDAAGTGGPGESREPAAASDQPGPSAEAGPAEPAPDTPHEPTELGQPVPSWYPGPSRQPDPYPPARPPEPIEYPGRAAASWQPGPPPGEASPPGERGPATERPGAERGRATEPATGPAPKPPAPGGPWVTREPSGSPDWQRRRPADRPDGPRGTSRVYPMPGQRSSPWLSRVGIALVGVAVLAVGGYFLLSSVFSQGGSGGTASTGSGQLAALTLPGCTTQVAKARELNSVGTRMVATGTEAFDVAVTNGRALVSGSGLTVLDLAKPTPVKLGTYPLSHSQGEALTPDHQHLLVTGGDGLAVFLVSQLEHGAAPPVGTLSSPGEKHAVEVVVTPDGKFAFVTYQNSAHVGVFNLDKAFSQGFGPGDRVGLIKVGPKPIGIAMSPDGDHVFVTSKKANSSPTSTGVVQVIDVKKAETTPGSSSVIRSVDAGCGPSRVITSADGKQVWVTASDSNALLGFDAAKLISGSPNALIARVPVGQLPLGLVFVRNGTRIVVADSDRDKHPGSDSNLAVVDVPKALAQDKSALLGYARSGETPRQFALSPNGNTLLVTNTDSGQLQTLSIKQLP